MKKSILFCLAIAMAWIAQSANITFRVNMNLQTVSPNGVHVAGNFQGWNPATSAMTDANGDGIYEATISVTNNQTLVYKFINGNSWTGAEIVPTACGVNDGSNNINRNVVVNTSDIILEPVCFGQCANCPSTIQVTLRVNMKNQTVGANGVHVAGNFQGWNPASSPLADADGDGIYSGVFLIGENQTIEYKFINGNAWGMDESVPAACATGSNRTLVVGNANITTTAFCFGECAECTIAPIAGCTNANACNYNSNATQDDGSCLVVGAVCNDNNANTENDVVSANCVCAGTAITGSVQVTFQVNMSQQTVSPMGVYIAGNFQGWNPSTTAMTDANGDNIYEYTATLTPNQTIEYKFINGNAWGMDESVPAACATGSNRTLVVTNANITTTAFCFGECAACGTVAVPGCTNSTACNFDSAATEDDGSCIAVGDACNDNDATTVNDVIGANCQCAGSAGIPTMVIFRVDMTNQNVSPNGVFVVGTFNNWDLTLTQMTEYQPGFYQAVAFINAGETIQYKFVNGGTWTGSETVPSACGTDDGTGNINRSATIGNTALTMEPVCFSECGACVAIPMTAVTFTVNMSQQTVDPNGVQVVGSFQNWTLNASAMTNTGNGLYSFTTNIPTGTSIQYKFINGNTWSGAETVAFGCAVNDGSGNYNRAFNVTGTAVNIPTVCFNECENCIMAGCTNPSACNYDATATTDDGSCLITNAACDDGNANTSNDIVNADCVCLGTPVAGALQVTFRVNMSQQSVSAQGVHIAGNFQNWDPAATEMTDGDGDGIFEYTTFLTQNQTIEYKFINGNSWGAGIDESVPAACAANNNRTLVLSTTNVTTPAYCFGSCSPCESNVIVVFQVDMTNETVAAGGVHVATNWDGFNPNANLMTDLGNGVYEVAVTLPANETTLFRFVNGNGTNQFETVPLTCGVADGMGNFNRAIAVGTTNTTFGPVCFSGCANCQPIVPVQVTFQVDMSNQTVDPNGVHIAGEFQNPQWDPAATIMTDNGNGIWSYTTTVNSGSTFQYKFINGNAWTGEESVPMECGNPNGLGGYNRIFTVGTNDVILNTVCFGECAGCNTGADIAVTFQVNLSEVAAVSPNGVHLVGSFQNYDPAATPMTDQGNGIYSVQVTIPSGSFIFYRFINGNTNADAEIVPFSCGVLNNGGYFERVAQLDSTTTEMPLVCFSECNDCGNAIEENANPLIQVYPNPSSVYCTLQSQELIQHYAIVDATGRKIAEGNGIGQYALPINIQNWENGIYVIIVNHQHRLPLMKTE